jgi:hypothetical protein
MRVYPADRNTYLLADGDRSMLDRPRPATTIFRIIDDQVSTMLYPTDGLYPMGRRLSRPTKIDPRYARERVAAAGSTRLSRSRLSRVRDES